MPDYSIIGGIGLAISSIELFRTHLIQVDHAWISVAGKFIVCQVWFISYRMTVFTFLKDATQEETTIEFTGEDPYLQYVSLEQYTCMSKLISVHDRTL